MSQNKSETAVQPGPKKPSPDPSSPPTWPVSGLWYSYMQERDAKVRNQLVQHYLPLVRMKARHFNLRGRSLEYGDLVGYGIIGLIQAIDSYTFPSAASFEAYSSKRIRGAILDALRANDPLPRNLRARTNSRSDAIQVFYAAHGRRPSCSEITCFNDLTDRKRAHDRREVLMWVVEQVEEARSFDVEELPDMRGDAPDLLVQRREIREVLRRKLHGSDLAIIKFYYDENKSQREIAALLKLSESSVSQFRTRILQRLRCLFKKCFGDHSNNDHYRAADCAARGTRALKNCLIERNLELCHAAEHSVRHVASRAENLSRVDIGG